MEPTTATDIEFSFEADDSFMEVTEHQLTDEAELDFGVELPDEILDKVSTVTIIPVLGMYDQ
ncbi:uncharacterized protein BJ212DRAFT_1483619 [Suillus subaureus]|uniref:Uncharacterized protein n=1 Tax=Suillus subaureus TaxID=48587 RepID=A0A9P7JAR6_9AGAM|nr:uncharacterized protein BJ212DRAFT_1483619 [Suillus subaureus]KAG1811370.1 hypothetical protein BJ212DRAFT_1483619 [Suillus subaureus]